jgi:YesN/AraC family two-component response regulator
MAGSTGVLIVDDERVICETMQQILAGQGYRTEIAMNGEDALRCLRERDDIAVLLTDIVMPGMDGLVLIHEARKLRPRIVPILVSGIATFDTARAVLTEGVQDYLLKPFTAAEVRHVVVRALERRPAEV